MKKSSLLALLMVLTLGLNANIDPKSQCRMDSAELNLCENLTERIKLDLLSSTWTESLEYIDQKDGVERIFQFQEIGLVEITTIYADGRTDFSKQIWRVHENNNQAFLILTDIGSDISTAYEMKQTCNGMVLKDRLLEKEFNWIVQ